jgi:hypothetical protein
MRHARRSSLRRRDDTPAHLGLPKTAFLRRIFPLNGKNNQKMLALRKRGMPYCIPSMPKNGHTFLIWSRVVYSNLNNPIAVTERNAFPWAAAIGLDASRFELSMHATPSIAARDLRSEQKQHALCAYQHERIQVTQHPRVVPLAAGGNP